MKKIIILIELFFVLSFNGYTQSYDQNINYKAVSDTSIINNDKNDTNFTVNIIDFSYNCEFNRIELLTLSETDNDYFIILSSQNSLEWKEYLKIKSNDNSTITRKYIIDAQKYMYYKLIQYRLDGSIIDYEIFYSNCDSLK